MQNGYERRDAKWSEDRLRYTGQQQQLAPPQQAYGWTPTFPQGGWRDATRTPKDIFNVASASTFRFMLLCGLWYLSSALSSNTGKSILQIFKFPVTLTIVQFAFISGYCLLLASPLVRATKLRRPNAAILKNTIPMGAFQVGGHIFSSMAISRIPVSTVHTIKALSPLFTVAAYAMLFGVKYSASTYISLLPLTIGVMLACTFDMSASNMIGLLCAFGSALIFVSSNIFFKKIMPTPTAGSAPSAHRLDKINLLFYSSGIAFIMMIPIWLYSDFVPLLSRWTSGSIVASNRYVGEQGHSVTYYFFANGTVHFLQNIIAFAILATTSPVTYSIASLIKRIAVICIAIVWFAQPIHPVQGLGICLTFAGLWMYNRAKGDVERGEKIVRRVEAMNDLILPTTKEEVEAMTLPEEKEAYAIRANPPTIQHRSNTTGHPAHHHHQRTYSREHPPAPLNTNLAASTYVPKYVPILSPPNETNPAQGGIMVDPYPSPPKSPSELDNLIPKAITSSGNDSGQNNLFTRNRRATIQNQHAAKDSISIQ